MGALPIEIISVGEKDKKECEEDENDHAGEKALGGGFGGKSSPLMQDSGVDSCKVSFATTAAKRVPFLLPGVVIQTGVDTGIVEEMNPLFD